MRVISFFSSAVFSFAVLLIAYAVSKYLNVPVGNFGDWVAGLLILLWLLVVVTVPWNLYFKASALIATAGPGRERGLPVDDTQLQYVKTLQTRTLTAAIALHIVSAVVLLILAATGVTRLGYLAAALALLLTVLRPAISFYEYIADRLRAIGDSWRFPNEDVVELRIRLDAVETRSEDFARHLDATNPDSLIAQHLAHVEAARQQLAKVSADIATLSATNNNAHEQLSQEAKTAVSQLSEDGRFLDHVREIIRFFKKA